RTVNWLLDDNCEWRRDRLAELFGESLVQRILLISTNVDNGTDRPNLVHSPLAMTITAMAYKVQFADLEYQFNWMRKLKLHPREHFFWWRLLLNALPTKCWLLRRGLTDSSDCPWGCRNEESSEHILIHCDLLKLTLTVLNRWGFTMPEFHSLDELIGGLYHAASHNPSFARLYCYIIYQIWRARNDKIHGRPHCTPSVIAANALAMLPKPYLMPVLEQWCTSRPLGLSPNKLWCTPPPGWVKFNVDASLQQSSITGLGVVVRDHLGRLVVAAGTRVEQWDTTTAEIMAALSIKDLIEQWMTELEGIIIEGDCRNALRWLQASFDRRNKMHLQPEGPDLTFLLDFKQVLFQYVPRLSNAPADYCARMACF
ncbi:uncharacterized protein LOC110106564, partial [Dendrobium catenatum]|uniref:uncharacterized protein LOC110106564 n=1 Tax=Dendrobium catenatum TaxID=906689 RepID=UPI00109FDCB7